MQKNSLHNFVFFGTAFRFLQDASPHADVKMDGGILFNIGFVLDFFAENKMKVCANASWRLNDFKRSIEASCKGGDVSLSFDKANELKGIMKELRPTVLAEAEEVTAFFPSEKRYNVDRLYSDVSSIFGVNAFGKLPENAQRDFSEAGKCIVLERATAASYHLMRGAECTLKQLYYSVVKKGRKPNAAWGPMVQHLEQRKALDEALKGTLDNFRRGFRNPVAHPDTFYSIDEAQDLLGTTTQLVALIVSHPKYVAPNP